jgi:hypothetical protein
MNVFLLDSINEIHLFEGAEVHHRGHGGGGSETSLRFPAKTLQFTNMSRDSAARKALEDMRAVRKGDVSRIHQIQVRGDAFLIGAANVGHLVFRR